MSRKSLEHTLGRAPLAPVFFVSAAVLITLLLTAYGIFAAVTLRIIDLLICIAGIYFLIKYALRHFGSTLKAVEQSKKNGAESLNRLKSRNLLEQAAEEYNGADALRFRPESSGFSPEKFTLHQNILTPNFIFIMTDNAVFEYGDIRSVGFYRRNAAKLFPIGFAEESITTLTLITTTGERFDFYTCRGALADTPAEDIICGQIVGIIEQLNPECEIDFSIKVS